MLRFVVILIISLFLFSCGSQNEDTNIESKPEHLLDKEEFTNMLTDSYLIEAAIRQGLGKGENAADLSRYFYPKLFEKYNITEEDFKENIRYYSSRPELMQEIQTEMVNRLSHKEEELNNLPEDSLIKEEK